MNIRTIREKYPQYSDLTDKQLIDAIHEKYYKDIPIKKFYEKVKLTKQPSLVKNVNSNPEQNTAKANNATEIAVSPKVKPTEQTQSDIFFYFLVVIVGLLVWFFKTKTNKDTELNGIQTRSEAERIKVDEEKQKALEVELIQARAELKKQTRLEAERIKVDEEKQKALRVEIYKSFEKQASSNVDLNRLAKSASEFTEAESIEIDNKSIKKYKLGDIGPYGGVVFYINDSGTVGIEAKSKDESLKMNWNKSIIAINHHENDWYLPTKNELDLLYKQKDTVGGFTNADYWCSTEYNTDALSHLYPKSSDAWIQSFGTGYQYIGNKNLNLNVRAIRNFDYSEVTITTPVNTGEQYKNVGARSTVVIIKDENTGKFEDMF